MSASEEKPRARKENFTHRETTALLESYSEYKTVLQSKHRSTVTNKGKNSCWDRVTAAVNAVSVVGRSKTEIQQKWSKLASAGRSQLARRKRPATGGGPAPKESPYAELIGDIIGGGSACISGLVGGIDSGCPIDAREAIANTVEFDPSQSITDVPMPDDIVPVMQHVAGRSRNPSSTATRSSPGSDVVYERSSTPVSDDFTMVLTCEEGPSMDACTPVASHSSIRSRASIPESREFQHSTSIQDSRSNGLEKAGCLDSSYITARHEDVAVVTNEHGFLMLDQSSTATTSSAPSPPVAVGQKRKNSEQDTDTLYRLYLQKAIQLKDLQMRNVMLMNQKLEKELALLDRQTEEQDFD